MNILRKLIAFLVVAAAVGVGVLFALQNTVLVPLDVLVYNFEPRSLALWVLAAFGLGGVLGMLTFTGIVVSLRASRHSTQRQLQKARAELDKLRTAGITESE